MAEELDLTPPEVRITMYGGDDERVQVTVTNDGIGEDLSGYTDWLCQVKADKWDDTPAFTATVDDTNADEGIIGLLFAAADTAGVLVDPATSWTGYWDLQGTNATGDDETFIGGPISIVLDVSRVVP